MRRSVRHIEGRIPVYFADLPIFAFIYASKMVIFLIYIDSSLRLLILMAREGI